MSYHHVAPPPRYFFVDCEFYHHGKEKMKVAEICILAEDDPFSPILHTFSQREDWTDNKLNASQRKTYEYEYEHLHRLPWHRKSPTFTPCIYYDSEWLYREIMQKFNPNVVNDIFYVYNLPGCDEQKINFLQDEFPLFLFACFNYKSYIRQQDNYRKKEKLFNETLISTWILHTQYEHDTTSYTPPISSVSSQMSSYNKILKHCALWKCVKMYTYWKKDNKEKMMMMQKYDDDDDDDDGGGVTNNYPCYCKECLSSIFLMATSSTPSLSSSQVRAFGGGGGGAAANVSQKNSGPSLPSLPALPPPKAVAPKGFVRAGVEGVALSSNDGKVKRLSLTKATKNFFKFRKK